MYVPQSMTRNLRGCAAWGLGIGNGLKTKKFRCVSTKRREYQSRGSDDRHPSRYAWSRSSPRGHRRYGAVFERKTRGGIMASRIVRLSVAREMSRKAIRGPEPGSVSGSSNHSLLNSANAESLLAAERSRFAWSAGRTFFGFAQA